MMKKTLFVILFFVFILTGCTIESFIGAGDVPPTESTGHSVYYKIDIDHSEYEPSHSSEGVTLTVCEYSHSGAICNNGETEEPELTVLQFELKCDTQGLEEQDDFRLYRNEDGEFVDITPADVGIKAVIQYYGHMITLYMQSSELGGLPAGDYRAEYGPYYVDFKMSEQLYVVD